MRTAKHGNVAIVDCQLPSQAGGSGSLSRLVYELQQHCND